MKNEGMFRSRRDHVGEIDVAYGEAMLRAVERHAKVKQRKGKWLRFNAWWRDGKGLNASLDTESGFITDWTNGDKLGAKDLADILGMDFKDLMAGVQSTWRRPTPPDPERTGMPQLWERLIDVEARIGRAQAPASRWLRKVRGFPDDVDVTVDSGYVTVGRASINAFPHDLQKWAAGLVDESGIHVAAPMRDSKTGQIRGLQLRPIGAASATGKRRWIPGTFLRDAENDAPRGYGFAHMATSASTTVFVEGFADTVAAELFLRGRNDDVAVGAASSSTVQHWAAIFAVAKGRVVIVPQIDRPRLACAHCAGVVDDGALECPACGKRHNPGRESQRAMAQLVATLRRLDCRVSVFDWDRFLAGIAVDDDAYVVKDLANAVRLAGFAKARDTFLSIVEGP